MNELAHYYGVMAAVVAVVNVFGIFFLAIGHLCGLRRYEARGSLVYYSAKYAFQSIFWPVGFVFSLSDIGIDVDLFAKMIRYDGSW